MRSWLLHKKRVTALSVCWLTCPLQKKICCCRISGNRCNRRAYRWSIYRCRISGNRCNRRAYRWSIYRCRISGNRCNRRAYRWSIYRCRISGNRCNRRAYRWSIYRCITAQNTADVPLLCGKGSPLMRVHLLYVGNWFITEYLFLWLDNLKWRPYVVNCYIV